jgi:hypothetical protein
MSTALAGRRSAAVTGRPGRARRGDRGEHAGRPTLFEAAGGEPTLDEVLVGVWEGLTAHRVIDCPVCGARMEPTFRTAESAAASATGPVVQGGHCASCDSTLT